MGARQKGLCIRCLVDKAEIVKVRLDEQKKLHDMHNDGCPQQNPRSGQQLKEMIAITYYEFVQLYLLLWGS